MMLTILLHFCCLSLCFAADAMPTTLFFSPLTPFLLPEVCFIFAAAALLRRHDGEPPAVALSPRRAAMAPRSGASACALRDGYCRDMMPCLRRCYYDYDAADMPHAAAAAFSMRY